jgi:hypothetical protein
MTMAEKNIQMQRKTATGYDKYYPKTKAGLVEFADGTTVEAHKSASAIHKTSDVIRTETGTKLKVEVISSSGSVTPEAGRIIFDTSQGKFFGGTGSGWV